MSGDGRETRSDVLGARVGAALVDIVLMGVLFVLMAMALGESESSDGGFSISLSGGPFLLYLVLVFVYYFATEAYAGGTIGKRLLNLRVVRVDGEPLQPRDSAIRNLVRFIDILPVFYLVGFVVAVMRPDRRRLGDLAAGTMVVRGG